MASTENILESRPGWSFYRHPKPHTRGFGTQNTPIGGYLACSWLVLYGIRAPIIGPAWSSLQNVVSGCQWKLSLGFVWTKYKLIQRSKVNFLNDNYWFYFKVCIEYYVPVFELLIAFLTGIHIVSYSASTNHDFYHSGK